MSSKSDTRKVKCFKLKPGMKIQTLPCVLRIETVECAGHQFGLLKDKNIRLLRVSGFNGPFQGMTTVLLVPAEENVDVVLRDSLLKRVSRWIYNKIWAPRP